VNVVPITTEAEQEPGALSCPNCGTAVLADQRYCLSCGHACSPVRLAFLDVLQTQSDSHAQVSIAPPPAGYMSPMQEDDSIGWLRRYSGLLSLLSVLLVTALIGLLVGHWLAPAKAPTTQVLRIEGGFPLAAGAPGGASTTAASAPRAPAPAKASASAKAEAQEVKEVKEAESPKAKPPPPVKTSSSSLKKVEKLTGKQHQKAIEELTAGGKPIETGK
jgi:hypothetical protein